LIFAQLSFIRSGNYFAATKRTTAAQHIARLQACFALLQPPY
jgi:hypothetical protein